MPVKEPSLKNLTQLDFGDPGEKQHVPLQELTRPHIDSFNHMLTSGLTASVKEIPPVEFALPSGQRVALSIQDTQIYSPAVAKGNVFTINSKVYPTECREGGKTYKGSLMVRLHWSLDGVTMAAEDRIIGEIPIMVKSSACNLHKLRPSELVRHGEEAEEMGGYFIINGNEKLIRMLIMPRRNYPTTLCRPSWKNRGPQYTEFGVSLRSVKSDQTASNIVLHYLNNGTATLSFSMNKEQFFVPLVLILKALVETTDQVVYSELIKGVEEDSFYKGCVSNMLRLAQEENLTEQQDILQYIGHAFRVKCSLPDWYTDSQVTQFLLKHCICIHLARNLDKFNLLVLMTRKLYSFAHGKCAAESADNPMFQEVLLGGHLYQMVLKEKIESWLFSLKTYIEIVAKRKGAVFKLDNTVVNQAVLKGLNISKSMEYLMATGNLISRTGLGLMQVTGLTVMADKLNFMRYVSHFRCIHRGAFFAQMRTTSVRKLLPEAWGFLCPVHTPDGPPCGLMNHMSASCQIVNISYDTSRLPGLLCRLGMTPYESPPPCPISECYPVMLDGLMVGWVPHSGAQELVERLRTMKVKGLENVPRMMEICLVPQRPVAAQYPGVSLFTATARMMRPVTNLALNATEMIGTFEQAYMNICITPEEAHEGKTTHMELSQFAMLSAIASLTPFSDFNQSPRNMYQCQMGKQTMGSPLHAWPHRADNKLYRIQTPQSPIVRPYMHDNYSIDNYPLGTNAVVCVISYTGYDMEDAFILNKSSFERGFGHGTVYKSEFVDLKKISREGGKISLVFGCDPKDPDVAAHLDVDGLPPVGAYLTEGNPYYSYLDLHTGEYKVMKYKSSEPARVDNIKLCGSDLGNQHLTKICIVLRIQRNPIIGDKFSSRHGQKGICSQQWPVENMPFSESGMTPDILFNPHGYPSRMTIGMMIESMAGKSASMHGICHDATPFTFSEEDSAIDYMGRMLTEAGYNYYGTERMYSGVDGREFEADIFVGVVYYQRLRHMVSDKFQVRTTGAVEQLTRQPVKGRKRGGGVRFGEMERDALLAHGTSFLLHDRLLNCSDESKTYVCTKCGCLLSPLLEKPKSVLAGPGEATNRWCCLLCQRADTVQLVRLPYVFRYLVAELASMNIKTTLAIKPT